MMMIRTKTIWQVCHENDKEYYNDDAIEIIKNWILMSNSSKPVGCQLLSANPENTANDQHDQRHFFLLLFVHMSSNKF